MTFPHEAGRGGSYPRSGAGPTVGTLRHAPSLCFCLPPPSPLPRGIPEPGRYKSASGPVSIWRHVFILFSVTIEANLRQNTGMVRVRRKLLNPGGFKSKLAQIKGSCVTEDFFVHPPFYPVIALFPGLFL